MNKNRVRDALERIVRRGVSDNIDLWPGIESRLKQKDALNVKPRFKLSSSLALALLALLLVGTAAYAYFRFLGSDAGLEGVNQQNLISDIEVIAVPTVYSTPPLATPITRWVEESSAPPVTVVAEDVMQDVKVILNWAYADESRVAVRFTITGLNLPEGLDYGYGAMGTFSLRDLNGNALGQDGFSTAAENREDGSKVITAIYYGKIDADKTPALELKMNIRVGGFDAPYSPPGSEGKSPEMRNIPLMGSTEFEFSIPVYKGFVITVNQSVEKNGVRMRLENLTVNPSHTEMLMCFNMPSAKDWQLWKTTLRIGESREYTYSMAAAGMSNPVKDSNGERCITMGFDAPYDGAATTMTITIPYLITPVYPAAITDERVEMANRKLINHGIVFEYVDGDVKIFQKPADMKEWEAYSLVWDALADWHDGPWVFTVPVMP